MNSCICVMAFTLGVTTVDIREVVIVNVLTINIFLTNEENLISSTSCLLALLLSLSIVSFFYNNGSRAFLHFPQLILLVLEIICCFWMWLFCLKLTTKWYTLAGKTDVGKFFNCFEPLKIEMLDKIFLRSVTDSSLVFFTAWCCY